MIELRRCLGGREAGRAWCQGGLSSEGAALSGAGFLRTDVDLLLLLADNCHRDFWRSLRGHLQFSILWAVG